MKPFLLVFTFICTLTQVHAQRFSSKVNRLGIGADATFLKLESSAVNTQTKIGYTGYLETRGEFSRSFDVLYAVGIFSHAIQVEEFTSKDLIEASMLGAEVKFMFAFRPFSNEYLTLEAGPALMLNGEFDFDDIDKSKVVGTEVPVTIEEFQKTNMVNLNGVIGLSAGTNHIRLTAHYHHAFFDALDGVDSLGNELNGDISYLSAGIRFYF